ncbi:MAG: hypothetical protein WAQ05_17030 [Rubrivivax sp.]
MARTHVPASLLRRVDALTDKATGEPKRPGVMLMPRMMGLDEWEKVAMAQQREALEAAREDREVRGEPRIDVATLPEAVIAYGYSTTTGEVHSRIVGKRPPLPPGSAR